MLERVKNENKSSLISKSQEPIGKMLLRNLKTAGRETYAEGIAPLVHGASTLAFGIPRVAAKTTGTKELIYPEQKTFIGKTLRLGAEGTGYLAGGAAKGGQLLLKGAKAAVPKLAGKGLLKQAGRGAIVGAGFGALQTPEEGKGVLRLKEWARKLSLLTLGLFILIMIPVPHVNLQIVIVKIVFICISLSIIYLLSLKNVKKQFSKG